LEGSSDLFYQAATLMLVGMAFVYAFLSLLIIVIKTLIAPLANRFPDPIPQPARVSPSDNNQQNESIIAAISAAVTQYRRDRQ